MIFRRIEHKPVHITLWRRLIVIIYDGLLLFGVLFLASLPLLILTGGEAVKPGNSAYSAYLSTYIKVF